MTILDKIVDRKKREVEERRVLHPVQQLENSEFFPMETLSMKKHLALPGMEGIIAEFKRKSPSKGVLNETATPEATTVGYVQAGASALSVLTDGDFFGGSNDDLLTARRLNACPILRKDFIVDEYQVIEAKSIGADVILLIAATTTAAEGKRLTALAHSLGMEVLLEVHNEEEWHIHEESGADIVGVNNRNLRTFEVSLDTSKQIAPILPVEVIRVAESGISSPTDVLELRNHGFRGFLIGESFMKHRQPEVKAGEFIDALRRVRNIIY